MHLRGLIFISRIVNREKEPHIRCIHLTYSIVGNMLCPESSYFFPPTIKGVETICSDEVIHALADISIQKREREKERERGRERYQRCRKDLVSRGWLIFKSYVKNKENHQELRTTATNINISINRKWEASVWNASGKGTDGLTSGHNSERNKLMKRFNCQRQRGKHYE